MQIQQSSEITSPFSTMSIISGYARHLRDLDKEIRNLNDKKYSKNYAHA